MNQGSTNKTERDEEVEEGIEQPVKKSKPSVDSVEESPAGIENREDMCVVCMETNNSERPLLPEHQCSQCRKGAWKICVCCNDSILSRTCPVCRSNYAPILLHVVPGKTENMYISYNVEFGLVVFDVHTLGYIGTGVALNQLADKTLSAEDKSMLLYKFGIVRHLIMKSNVAVWNREKEEMHFSLPREFAEDTQEICCLTVTIPMKADRIVDNTFVFNNDVWDEFENEVETGASQTGEMMASKQAVQWLLSFTRHSDHQILSMMSAEDWEHMLDPTKSQDTQEALQSIKSSIVLPIATAANVVSAATAPSSTTSGNSEKS